MYFSVIIPTYNRLAFLREAVESVLNQTFTDFELIVVDDASTDATSDWLSTLAGKHSNVRFVRHADNRGVSAARNTGIQNAAGRFVAFLDSDDLWKPDKLERQHAYLSQHTEIRMVHTNEIWIRNDRELSQKSKHRKQGGYFFERSLELCLVSPSAVAIDRTLLIDAGMFDESLPACEDYDLWLRLNLQHPFGFIDEPSVIKRGGHADQLSSAAELDVYRIQSLRKILSECPLSEDQRFLVKQTIVKKAQIVVQGAAKRGKTAQAAEFEEIGRRYA